LSLGLPAPAAKVPFGQARATCPVQPPHIIAANITGLSLARFPLTGPAANRGLLFCHSVRPLT